MTLWPILPRCSTCLPSLSKVPGSNLVLTSYNANPRATAKWMRTLATEDDLIFIERIPYKETKQYVKLVLRNFFYYKYWYGDWQTPIPIFDNLVQAK